MLSHNIFHTRFGFSMPGRSAVLPCFDSIMFGSSEMSVHSGPHVNEVRYLGDKFVDEVLKHWSQVPCGCIRHATQRLGLRCM